MTEVEKVYGPASAVSPKMTDKKKNLQSKPRHPHLTCYSPLRVRDAIPLLHSLPPISVQQRREREYVVDAIKTDVFFNSPYHRPRRQSIIRPYDALKDRHSAGYFRSPIVREVITRTVSAQVRPKAIFNFCEPTHRIPAEKRGLHRMSARSRSIPTPPPTVTEKQEKDFVLDNIRTERLRNKQNPIIPEYDASADRHSRRYFRRKLVQNVLRRTKMIPHQLYPTITFYAPTKNDIVV